MTPRVSIRFCRACGFHAPAEQIAEALRQQLGLTVECRPGFWSCFHIELDGAEVFNRWKTRGWLGRLGCGRTPTPDEILETIRGHLIPARKEVAH